MSQEPTPPSLPDYDVDPKRFDILAKAAGYTRLSARSLMANAEVGRAIKQLGAVKIGRSELLLSTDQLKEVFEIARDMTELVEPTEKIEILKVMTMAAKMTGMNAARMIKSAEVDMSDGSQPRAFAAAFLPMQRAQPEKEFTIVLEETPK